MERSSGGVLRPRAGLHLFWAGFPAGGGKLSRLAMLMSEVREKSPRVEMVRYPMEDDRAYSEGLRRLASNLREIGEEDFSSRVAFSLHYVLHAVAVDGKLVAH